MKKFVVRLLLFCLAPLPLLFLLNYIVDEGLRRSKHSYYSEWNDIFAGRINADVLVMGSSRAWVQISPRVLDTALHVNSYNLGMDGAQFNLQKRRFDIYLQHNKKPKYIIQEIGYTSTFGWINDVPAMQQFLPYLHDTSVWALTQWSTEPYTLLDRYFPLYKYNNEFSLISEGVKSYFGKGVPPQKYKGYMGHEKTWDSTFHDYITKNPKGRAWPVSREALDHFRAYLTYCRSNGIKVIFVFPPAFIQSLDYIRNKEEIAAIISSLCREYGIPFLSYVNDPLCYSRDNFYNSMHMNRRGAEAFSQKLAADLKPYIQ